MSENNFSLNVSKMEELVIKLNDAEMEMKALIFLALILPTMCCGPILEVTAKKAHLHLHFLGRLGNYSISPIT